MQPKFTLSNKIATLGNEEGQNVAINRLLFFNFDRKITFFSSSPFSVFHHRLPRILSVSNSFCSTPSIDSVKLMTNPWQVNFVLHQLKRKTLNKLIPLEKVTESKAIWYDNDGSLFSLNRHVKQKKTQSKKWKNVFFRHIVYVLCRPSRAIDEFKCAMQFSMLRFVWRCYWLFTIIRLLLPQFYYSNGFY